MNIQMKLVKKASLVLLVLLLGACQTTPKNDDGDFELFKEADFASQYQKRLESPSWKLKGAFSFANDIENVQGKVIWSQAEKETQIQLIGPLGVGSVRLSLEPDVATMQQGKQIHTAASADELMLKVLGWQMPLRSLNYWLYGLPARDQKTRYRTDEKGQIVELQQSGWLIRFKQYRQLDGFSLLMPRKIFASHVKTGTNVRLVVTKMSR